MTRPSAFVETEGILTIREAVRIAIASGRDAAEAYLIQSGLKGGETQYVLLFIDYHLFEEMQQRRLEERTRAWEDWPDEIRMLLTYYLGEP